MKATAPRKLTVLQVIPKMHAGGTELGCLQIAEALVVAGHRAIVASAGGRMVEPLEAAGAEHVSLPLASKNPLVMLANVGRLARLIQRQSVDIVHARSRAPAWSSLLAARLAGIPLVTTYQGAHAYAGPLKSFYNSVMARGDMVIANSEYTAARIREHHAIPENRLVVIHRGVDLAGHGEAAVAAERMARMRAAWGLGEGTARIVLLPARLSPRKGHEVAFDAMHRLRRKGVDDIVLVCVGGAQGRNDFRARLTRGISALGLDAIVILAGHCTDMPAAYAASDLVLVPSTEPEAFGRVAGEAQAMGVPVVASDLGAVSEIVLAPPEVSKAERTGWRVPAGDAAALAAAIETALGLGPAARRALVKRGQAHVRGHFTLQGMNERTFSVYDRLLGSDLAARSRRRA